MPNIIVHHNHPRHEEDYYEHPHEGCSVEVKQTVADRVESAAATAIGTVGCLLSGHLSHKTNEIGEEIELHGLSECFGQDLRRMVYGLGDNLRDLLSMERINSRDTFKE